MPEEYRPIVTKERLCMILFAGDNTSELATLPDAGCIEWEQFDAGCIEWSNFAEYSSG